ncbi:Mitochondrial 5'-3' exonuclease and sliding exonuclease [Mactra antiquata]
MTDFGSGDAWGDSDEDLLIDHVEKYEKSRQDSHVINNHCDDDDDDKLVTPLYKFRPGYLWVSDFTRQNWCEQQMYYSFTVPTIFEENPVMTEGSNLHLARELAVHDVTQVKVTSNEDIWAVKVINLITALQTMLNGGTIVREVPVFGCPYNTDVFIVGLVDELKFDPETFTLNLSEFKTRKFRSFPSKSQQNTHQLQVMLYKKLFDDLVKGNVSKDTVARHLRLDLHKAFGDDILQTIDSKLLSSTNLSQLLDDLYTKIQCFTCVQELEIEYQHQESKDIIGKHSVTYDEDRLHHMFNDYIKFWKGKREVRGVDIEEAFKCQSCDFADICEWRKRKAEECSKRNKSKIDNS